MQTGIVFETSVYLAAFLALGAGLAEPTVAAEEGFVDLFNGRDLSGWVVEGTAIYKDGATNRPIWTTGNGLLRCAGSGFGFLRYDKPVKDFVLRVEFRMTKGCNSGIGVRSVKYAGRAATRPSFAGYEIQILDDSGQPPETHGTASLYRYVAPTENAVRPAGEWNEIEIAGPRIKIVLNGKTIQDVDQSQIAEIKDKPLSGYLSLQNHGSQIDFRNVRLKEIAGRSS